MGELYQQHQKIYRTSEEHIYPVIFSYHQPFTWLFFFNFMCPLKANSQVHQQPQFLTTSTTTAGHRQQRLSLKPAQAENQPHCLLRAGTHLSTLGAQTEAVERDWRISFTKSQKPFLPSLPTRQSFILPHRSLQHP